MFRILLTLGLIVIPTLVRAATCDAGYYLNNGECSGCPNTSYCPGDDMAYLCTDLWSGGVPNVSLNSTGHSSGANATSPDNCICAFLVTTPNDLAMTKAYYKGKCAIGPTDFYGVYIQFCRVGYYASNALNVSSLYHECLPCTNTKPENAIYNDRGLPDSNHCPWECDEGYRINADGTACDKLCTLGYTTLNTSTGVTVPLFADKRTTPSINIGDVNGACHADLVPGRATGAINVMYNGEIYHTVSATSTLLCGPGYWLNDDGVCENCGRGYYCTGDNTRQSCMDLIPDADKPYVTDFHDVSNGVWGAGDVAQKTTDCVCGWTGSDETRTEYYQESRCENGRPDLTYNYYWWCRVGYYAIRPTNAYDRYYGCAACYNGPPNSHYTSYSTPSVMYAVESNCPWECDDGYVRIGDTCVAEAQ